MKIGAEDHGGIGVAGALVKGPRTRRGEHASDRVAIDLLEFVGLMDEANIVASQLSYGARRRLEIARALATDPELILLDEPAAGTNPSEKLELTDADSSRARRAGRQRALDRARHETSHGAWPSDSTSLTSAR